MICRCQHSLPLDMLLPTRPPIDASVCCRRRSSPLDMLLQCSSPRRYARSIWSRHTVCYSLLPYNFVLSHVLAVTRYHIRRLPRHLLCTACPTPPYSNFAPVLSHAPTLLAAALQLAAPGPTVHSGTASTNPCSDLPSVGHCCTAPSSPSALPSDMSRHPLQHPWTAI